MQPRRLWSPAFFLTVLLVATAPAAADSLEEANALNRQAYELYQAGRYREALPLYQRILKIRREVLGPEHRDIATSLNNLAQLLKAMGAYQQALSLFQQALKIREKILGPHHLDTADLLDNLAGLYLAVGDYDRALPLFQRAIRIKEEALGPGHPDTAISYNNLAELYRAMGAYQQALPLYRKALKIFEQDLGPEHQETATCLNNLAVLHKAMGAYDTALPLFQRVLKISEQTSGPEHPDTAVDLNNLAELYRVMGLYDQALPLYHRSLKIREQALGPEHPATATTLNNLALLYETMGAYEKALSLYQRALKIREKALGPEHPLTLDSLGNLAHLSYVQGRYDDAEPRWQQVLKISERTRGPEHPDTAVVLNNLAALYRAMGLYEQARPLYRRALTIKEKVLGPEHPSFAVTLNNLGGLHLARKEYEAAEQYFRRAGHQSTLVYLFLARGQWKEALALLQNLAPTWRSTPSYQVQYHTQQGLALAGMGRRGEAALALLRAVQGVEELRGRASGGRAGFFQAGLIGGYIRPYRGLVEVLGEMALKTETLPPAFQEFGPDAAAAAFYFAEATKGRVLLETMAAAVRKEAKVEIPAELRAREERLLNQLAALEAQWEQALQGGEEAVQEVQRKKARLTGELQSLLQELRREYPLYAALHHPLPVPAADLPLKEDEVLLEYALSEEAGIILVVRRGGVRKVVRIPVGREELEEQIRAFMQPFLEVAPNAFSLPRGKQLYDLLLAGVLPEVKENERLIIIPDGILALLPFEALVVQPGRSFNDSVFVGDTYHLTYYQSAAVLALKRRLKAEPAGRLLFALGNPVFSDQDDRCRTAASREKPSSRKSRRQAVAFTAFATQKEWGKTTRSSQGQELRYPPLQETEDEVRAIARLLGVEPGPPDVLLNLEASETMLRRSPLGEYRYLHFATHADLSDKVQGIKEPFILLGQVGNQAGDDGFLTLSKVLGLKLKADLVTLSACVTGRGRVMEGEGVANFARAFQHAGAQSVLVSLWPVASQAAVEYMALFYGHLKEGKPRSQALQLARRAIRGKYPQPFFWAVFILHGQG